MQNQQIEIGDIVLISNFFNRTDKGSSEKIPITLKAKIVNIGSSRVAVKVLTDFNFTGGENNFTTLPIEALRNDIVLLEKGDNSHLKKVIQNVIKEETYDIYVSEFNQTWIDRLYNRYCKLLNRHERHNQKTLVKIVDNGREGENMHEL